MSQDKILIVDDERRMCAVLKAAFENKNLAVTTADSGEAALAALSMDRFDVVLSDIKMPGLNGLQVLEEIKRRSPETEVLLMTAYADAKTAVEAMKKGAFDYIVKPFEIDELRLKVDQILEKNQLRRENRDLKQRLINRYSIDNIIGGSGAMQGVFEMVDKVARSETTVLIRGESGTGKELVAKAIHHMSSRKDEPFLAVNCGALPENLLESELFGYEKGAFTGADRQKIGLFQVADRGTIFLDEIGEIAPSVQVKLLRVLQSKEIVRLGGTETISTHSRAIAATNKNLEECVREGSFREDLYYRINVFPIFLPPLRERKEDIPELVAHFLADHDRPPDFIDHHSIKLLMRYTWPGNVRELENVIERALILAGDTPITIDDLPSHIRGEGEIPIGEKIDEILTLDEMERRMIRQALARTEGNKTKAARLLGITRRQLYSKIERLGS
jgi:DNA-binding NtrC family response regulator